MDKEQFLNILKSLNTYLDELRDALTTVERNHPKQLSYLTQLHKSIKVNNCYKICYSVPTLGDCGSSGEVGSIVISCADATHSCNIFNMFGIGGFWDFDSGFGTSVTVNGNKYDYTPEHGSFDDWFEDCFGNMVIVDFGANTAFYFNPEFDSSFYQNTKILIESPAINPVIPYCTNNPSFHYEAGKIYFCLKAQNAEHLVLANFSGINLYNGQADDLTLINSSNQILYKSGD